MQKTLPEKAEVYAKQNYRRHIWRKIVRMMACAVVFCITYALILPAITMEKNPCDLEEHTHSESCYEKVTPEGAGTLACTYESLGVHVHAQDCYNSENVRICGQADYLIHEHNDDCLDENGAIVCQIPEVSAHVHTDACYRVVETEPLQTDAVHTHSDDCYGTEQGVLICQLTETEGHTHGQSCFTQGTLVCQIPEQEGHTHGEDCSETVLVCELTVEPHVHGDSYYQQLTCEMDHTHTEECTGTVQVCDLTELAHIHTEGCYETRSLCDLPETEGHKHGTDCYEWLLTCELSEEPAHQHTDECYEMVSVLICELEEGVTTTATTETQEVAEPERELICTEPAAQVHIHSEECFVTEDAGEDTLTCTLPEDENHTHSTICYGTWELICGKEEHTHDLLCQNDPEADVETEADWMATFAEVTPTGEWDEDLLTIARSQLGYQESTRNYEVMEDGETIKGYTRYGDWYGMPYGDWCAMFVSFCLNYADIPQDAVPYEANCPDWIEVLQDEEYELYRLAGEYTPVPGDLIFFDWEEDGTADHVGIVTELVPATEEEPAKIKTIEGNMGNQVAEQEYDMGDVIILGYAQLPEKPPTYYCGLQEHVHDESCTDENGVLICGIAEHTHTSDCGTVTDEEWAQVQQVIALIDTLPSADEIDAKIEEFENAEDYEGEEAWLSKVYSLIHEVYYIYYEPLTDNQKACVTNADKLLELECIWSATVLASYKFPVNFEVPVAAVNSTEGTSRNEWQGYVLTKSWLSEANPNINAFDKPESPIGLAYPYFRGHVIKENSDGSLTVAAAIQAGTLSNYTAQDLVDAFGTSDGFILISNTVVEGGIGTDYYDATGTVAQAVDFDWKTASGPQTDAAVNMNFTATENEVHVTEGTPLRNNIQAVGTRTVVMDADLNVERNSLTLSSGCHITLDLNGHLLTRKVASGYTGPLFEIPSGASLTIIDSQMGTETVETVSGNTYGNLAGLSVADSGDATLTYFVTETNVINTNTGATQETLKKHTISTRGAIVVSDQTAFHVTGGYLYIESGMVRGGSNRAIVQTGGLSHISGGYICGFHKPYNSGNTETSVNFTNADYGGAVYATNGVVHVSGSAVIAGNTAVAGGALSISGKTQLNITGGVISGNESTFAPTVHPGSDTESTKEFRAGGGGIILWNGSDGTVMNMTGGYITNNIARSEVYYDGGGGIFLRDDITVNLSGGYITGNKASSGGGIRGTIRNRSEIYMTGGFVSGNINTKAEGAGISMETQGFMELTAGYITNNRILYTVHWGGGGLFCSSSTTFYLKNALITNNDAGGYGGGVAGCSTGDIYLFVDAGCAAFDNSACVNNNSPHFVDAGSGKFGIDLQICNEIFRSHGNKDYFCAENSTVTGIMLGGGSSNWEGTADGAVVIVERDDTVTSNEVMGLEARPTEEAKQAAYDVAKVYINGNYSYTHGGGILCNGELIFGTPDDFEVPARLQVTKSLQNSAGEPQSLEGNDFTFQITESAMDGNVVATGTCGTDGYVTFDKQLIFKEKGTYTYYISEISGEKTDKIIYDHAIYRLTLNVDMDGGVIWYDGSTKYSYRVTAYTVEKSKDYGATWSAVTSGAGALTGTINLPFSTGYSFINYTMDFTDITVKKIWQGASEGSVTVFLKQNGVRYGDPVTLSSGNNWTYTWKDLESGPEYTVEEETPDGYSVKYLYATSSGEPGTVTLSGNVWWVPATSLTVGQQYMILNPDRTRALSVMDAHIDLAFDETDTETVTVIVGDLTIGGKRFSCAIADSETTSRAKFTAQSYEMKNLAGTATETVNILKCNAVDSWIMVSNSGGNWLKGTKGAQWASSLVYDGTWLRGHKNCSTDEQLRTFIFRNGAFTTNVVPQPVNGALLYTRVEGTATQATATEDAIVTITNTLKTNDLTIRKTVEGNSQDQQKAFAFELQLANSRFGLKNQYSAVRIAADGTVTTETIVLSGGSAEITLKHGESITIPELPYGTVWTVTEKNADGYNVTYTVNDGAVTSGKTVSGATGETDILVSFTNKPGYELPNTGGIGTKSYTIAGLMLLLCSMTCLMYRLKAHRREKL